MDSVMSTATTLWKAQGNVRRYAAKSREDGKAEDDETAMRGGASARNSPKVFDSMDDQSRQIWVRVDVRLQMVFASPSDPSSTDIEDMVKLFC
jgi:hypothetical protein